MLSTNKIDEFEKKIVPFEKRQDHKADLDFLKEFEDKLVT